MFVITQSCCSDAACVSVCPVNCIHPTPEERGFGTSDILHIDPEACIDCGACADACPVDAIFPAENLGTRDKVFIEINADYYKNNPDVKSGWSDVVYPEIPKLPAGLRVALVGTGPSGGYALRTLLDRTEASVTVIDKLPTPGGLVRAGVAPDHPGTKGVLRGFDLLYRDPRVTMATNVEVGESEGQITPAELAEHFDAVFYAVGASESRRLGIPGEDLPGSTSATELVAWYNAVPGADAAPPLRRSSDADPASGRAVIVGTGNVALDVARILVSPPELLATTDIADRALEILREQNVHEVVLLGRRDQAHAAYTSAEYRALSTIPGVEVVVVDDADGAGLPDLPGEDLPGSTSATELVAWYNAVPGADAAPPLRRSSDADPASGRAVIVGTGNVALDVARILVSPPELLATTDIADRALEILREQNVHEVVLLGRRDQAHAAYTSAEYRALSTIPGVEVVVVDDADGAGLPDLTGPADHENRRIVFLFHSTPDSIVGEDRVEGVTVTTGGKTHRIDADLAVRSIGYRSVPIPGLPFDDAHGVFPNVDGRMVDDAGQIMPGSYVVGWAKRGPSGGIGANKKCAQLTVEDFIRDALDDKLVRSTRDPGEFNSLLRKRTRHIIGYRGMRAIDRIERRRGSEQGRPRVKFTRVGDMVGAAGWRKR